LSEIFRSGSEYALDASSSLQQRKWDDLLSGVNRESLEDSSITPKIDIS
jgi:hypothetical protein